MQDIKLFKYIDEDKKYLGFTMTEIVAVIVVMVSGFVFNAMVLACIGCFGSVMVVRYVNHLLKISSFKRMIFFYFSDFIACFLDRQNIYGKYYL